MYLAIARNCQNFELHCSRSEPATAHLSRITYWQSLGSYQELAEMRVLEWSCSLMYFQRLSWRYDGWSCPFSCQIRSHQLMSQPQKSFDSSVKEESCNWSSNQSEKIEASQNCQIIYLKILPSIVFQLSSRVKNDLQNRVILHSLLALVFLSSRRLFIGGLFHYLFHEVFSQRAFRKLRFLKSKYPICGSNS